MHPNAFRRKLHYRAWHRGTREADAMVGGFFDNYADSWDAEQTAWFEVILEEQDVDIMAWAMGIEQPPAALMGPMMDQLRALDYIALPPGLESDTQN